MKTITLRTVGALLFALVFTAPDVYAAGKIEIDDTKWISVGLGVRTSFLAIEEQAPALGPGVLDHDRDQAPQELGE